MNNESKHIIPVELLSKYFANELNADNRAEVEAWRDQSEINKKEFNAFAKLWNVTGEEYTYYEIDTHAEWNRLNKTISKSGKLISINRIMQIAAAVLVLFGLTFIFLNQKNNIANKTQLAQVKTVNLPDGSVVTLNAESKLVYNEKFGTKNREVSLKGEAFFNVSSNKELPFIIDAQGASIQVVGTKFNVNAYKKQSEVKVTVVEGTVQLYESSTPNKKAVLNAGETGIYHKKKKLVKKHKQIDVNDVAWKTFEMSFEGADLKHVVQVISNVYHVNIEVADKVADCTVTVEFNQKNLAAVLKVLKSTLDLQITKNGNTIFINGEGC